MKTLLLSSTFLVIASATATAAPPKLPVRTAVSAGPVFAWTGCYIGAHAGGAALHTFTATNFEGAGTSSDNGSGAVAGGQVGCNYQAGNWVFGVEGEGSWSNGNATNSMALPGIGIVSIDSVSLTTTNNSDLSIAGRAGFTFDRTLIYGKGGWAWGTFDYNSETICCFFGTTFLRSGSYNVGGFLVGAGIEHALTRNWTVKFEYNYVGFGSKLLNLGADNSGAPIEVTTSPTKQTFKVGANYLFDFGGAPANY